MNPTPDARTSRPSGWRGRVAFHALGCKANQEEMECLTSRLVESGFEVVPFGEVADWTFVNTCTVTSAADSDSRQWVRRAAKAKEAGGTLVVTGCMAQRDPAALAGIDGVDWVVGNAEKPNLHGWVTGAQSLPATMAFEGRDSCTRVLVGDEPTLRGFAEYGHAIDGRRTRATLKVQDGCDEHCTFCVIPKVRGRSRSRPLAECREQARVLVESGYHEIALTGINTALWGRDFAAPSDLSELLTGLLEVEGLERIRLNSLEPQYVTDEWLDLLASSSRFCRHLHLPLQSGSDRVLKRMNRRYRTEDYRRVVEEAVRRMPDLAVGADVMIGFPGETEDEFGEMVSYLSSLPLAYLHVFTYSPRPDTSSLQMGEPIDTETRKSRSRELRRLSDQFRRRHAERSLDSLQTVIPEGATEDGWQGLTGNYLRVSFPWTETESPGTQVREVNIVGFDERGRVRGRLVS